LVGADLGAHDAPSAARVVERGGPVAGTIRCVDAAAGDEQHQQPAPVEGLMPAGGYGTADVAVVERSAGVGDAQVLPSGVELRSQLNERVCDCTSNVSQSR